MRSGLIARISSKERPQSRSTPALKFSITMSVERSRSLMICRPFGLRTLMVMLSFSAFWSLKWPFEFGPALASPRLPVRPVKASRGSGHSTLITSAPITDSQRVAHGPARTHVKSSTRTPSSGRLVMVILPGSRSVLGRPPGLPRGP